ncbi:MAG: transporter substrate-binding domain-containing protein [Gemmatimonadales bacterium]|nr:transporter substrate-binding domain-containing protein [Gemmatimonadales bacterium]
MTHPPRRSASRPVEIEIAGALATEIGAVAHFVQLDPHEADLEQAVLAGRCQAASGIIDDPSFVTRGRSPAGISLTDPYYAAGYVLVGRGDVTPVSTLRQLGAARVGVEKESIVAYTLRQRGHAVHGLSNASAVIRAVAERRLDYGYLWGPLAAGQLQGEQEGILIGQFVPADRWNVTIAVRGEAGELRHHLNRAIHHSLENGAVARIMAAADVPFLAPDAVSGNPPHAETAIPRPGP